MKNLNRLFVLGLGVLMAVGVKAQTVEAGASVLPYYLPKTIVGVQIKMETTESKPGPYAKYAKRFLGMENVTGSEQHSYQIKKIEIVTRGEADMKHVYQAPVSGSASHLTLTGAGVIKGVNLTDTKDKSSAAAKKSQKLEPNQLAAPQDEVVMLASSELKIAESAATQIYRLRESRMNLLCGDWSDMPADGKSTELLLKEMKQTEQQLTELFTGTSTTKTVTKTLEFVPSVLSKDTVLFRFSSELGVLGSDDFSGRPYRMVMKVNALKADKKAKADYSKPALYYCMPAEASITILDEDDNVVAEKTCKISEFGKVLVVPANLYKEGCAVRWNTATGALREVSEAGLGK